MPINFKSFTDYLFPTSTKTDGASGAGTAQAGNSRPSFSFSAMRNSGWAKKCAAFDAAKLARTISNDPRTKKAVETAKIGLNALYKQMTALVKNLRADLNNSGVYGGYRFTTEQQQINGRWRAILPQGATFLPGTAIDPQSRMETVRWHLHGVQWTSTYHPKTGDRTSSSDWSMMDAQGWQSSSRFDHQTKTNSTDLYHAATKTHLNRSEWSKPDGDGIHSRTTRKPNGEVAWEETFNKATGDHIRKSAWYAGPTNVMQRDVLNHKTGKAEVELEDITKPSDNIDADKIEFNLEGLTAAAFAAKSLALFGLDGTETDMEKIKAQYRKLSLQFHPDKAARLDEKSKAEATAKFTEVAVAFEFFNSKFFPVQENKG